MEFDSASLDWREPFGGRLYQNCLPGVRAIFENLKNPVRGRPARFVVLTRLAQNILNADGTSANQHGRTGRNSTTLLQKSSAYAADCTSQT